LTLIELLIALAAVAVVCGLALPALANARESARSASARGDLLASLVLAAGRAALAGNRAVLCPSADGAACSDDPGLEPRLAGLPRQQRQPRSWRAANRCCAAAAAAGARAPEKQRGPHPHRVPGQRRQRRQQCDLHPVRRPWPGRAVSLVMANNGRLRDGVPDAEALAQTCPR
jgi:type II secretory pathway pseudopilin PulG